MEINDTGKIMEVLSAFYGQGKSDTNKMLIAWHEILKDYPYSLVYQAVMTYAKNDRREYASFPAPGAIIEVIEKAEAEQHKLANRIFYALREGKPFGDLPEEQQRICDQGVYERGLQMDEEELLARADDFKRMIRKTQKRLTGGKA